jgi:phage-related protein
MDGRIHQYCCGAGGSSAACGYASAVRANSFLIKEKGLPAVHEPYVKHLTGKLWEMRLKGRDGIARSIYVTASGRRVVVLRSFVKKTEKTPRDEIELALKRMKDVKE